MLPLLRKKPTAWPRGRGGELLLLAGLTLAVCKPTGRALAQEEQASPTRPAAHAGQTELAPVARLPAVVIDPDGFTPAMRPPSATAIALANPFPLSAPLGQASWDESPSVGVAAALAPPTDTHGDDSAPLYTPLTDRFRADLQQFPARFWSDTKSLVAWRPALALGAAAGFSGIAAANWDQPVRDYTYNHARRWGGLNNVLDVTGHPLTHLGAAGAIYGLRLATQNDEQGEFAGALLNSLLLTDAAALSLKYAFDTERPNGKRQGFPSGHTASSFAAAAVIEEYHGLPAGLAAYTVAGLVGWQRIDNRNHDLSDVLFGAALGFVIGKTVAQHHHWQVRGCSFSPYVDPENDTTGLLLNKQY